MPLALAAALGQGACATWGSADRSAEIRERLKVGLAAYARKDWIAAAAAFRQAVDRDPFCLTARHKLGAIAYERGDWEGALDAFRFVVAVDPTYDRAYYNIGQILYAEAGRPDDALPFLRRYLALQPTGPRSDEVAEAIRRRLAEVRGALRGARPRVDEVMRADRLDAEIERYGRKGSVAADLYRLRQLERPEPLGLAAAPSPDQEIAGALRSLLDVDDRLARAVEALRRGRPKDLQGALDVLDALRADAASPALGAHAAYLAALAHGARGDAERAIASFGEAAARAPESVRFRFELGRALAAAGRVAEARAALDLVLTLDPGYDEARVAVELLGHRGEPPSPESRRAP